MSQSVLVTVRQAPYGSQAAKEALELAMAFALFDQKVSLLFVQDAVFQLLQGQDATQLGQKNIESFLQSLSLYGIDALYVCKESLKARGLTEDNLALAVEVLDADAMAQLIHTQDRLLNV